jgi:mono/diheme cytochrome c family protein
MIDRRAVLAALLLVGSTRAGMAAELSYSKDVAPILQAACQECHRPGGLGPFPLMSYADAKAHGPAIRALTTARRMPPWKAAAGYGEFLGERRLSQTQIETIQRWVETGMPEGDPADLPAPIKFPEGWTLGTPDLVLDAGEAFSVPARGADIYRNFVLPFQSEEDRWITGIEVSPGAAEVVHHVVLYLDPDGVTPEMDRKQAGPGFTVYGAGAGFEPFIWLQGWAPGAAFRMLPEGTAWRVPAGAHMVMQVHYHAHGRAVKDRTRVGLHFARGPVKKRVRTSYVGTEQFQIPAGAARHPVTASAFVPRDVTVLAVWPHMHQVGREMKVSATGPEGDLKPIVWVPEWDFNWQLMYALKEPLPLPAGTQLDLLAVYDNSSGNPANPSRPPKAVRFGPQTTDEMCYCFFLYTVDEEDIAEGWAIEEDGMEIRQ